MRGTKSKGKSIKNCISPTQKKVLGNVFYPLIALAIVLAIWAIAAAVKGKPQLLPMPDVVLKKFFALFVEKGFWLSVGWTVYRTLASFAISFVIAFAIAIFAGLWTPLHKIMSPIVSILRSVPTLAVILLLMIWVDYQQAPMYVGFLIAFPILYSAFYTAIAGVDSDLLEMSRVYKVKTLNKIKLLYVPLIMPSVFDISQSTVSLTLKVVIAAEILCQTTKSIGLNMQFANLTYDISNLLAWTVLAIVLSFVLELVVVALKKIWRVRK